MSFEGFLFFGGLTIGGAMGLIAGRMDARSDTLDSACGECDHVGECGDYECRPGVDGWQLKEGAR